MALTFDLDPAGWADVLDVEVAQQGRDVGLVNLGALVATRVQTHFGAFAFIPQVFHLVHGRHVFEFEDLCSFAAVKPVERLASNDLHSSTRMESSPYFPTAVFSSVIKSVLASNPHDSGTFAYKKGS